MALSFPSEAWAQAYGQAINQNPAYKKTASNWSEGAIALVCKAEPSLGIAEPQGMVLDLERGVCRGVVYTTDPAVIATAPFVIEASYAQWKSVIKGEVDPIKAMLQGQLRLSRGHLPTIIRDVEGSRQLVLSASLIDSEFVS
jgi:putative sterol carrier protein